MRQKNLTPLQILMVLLIIALLTFTVMAWGENIGDDTRRIGKILFSICLPIVIGVAFFDYRLRHRKDIEPDVLARFIDRSQIFDLGHVHFAMGASQSDSNLNFRCLVQNLHRCETSFELKFKENSRTDALAYPVPELQAAIPPAAVIEFTMVLPLRSGFHNSEVRLFLSGTSEPATSGQRVRFGRRQAVTQKIHPMFTALGLLGGHVVYGGGTTLSVFVSSISPQTIAVTDYAPAAWRPTTLWQPTN